METEIKIEKIRQSVATGDLPPQVAAEHLNELSALLGSVNSSIRLADLNYSKKLLECLSTEEKANRAKIKAEISEEYQIARRMKDIKELVTEMMRSLKYYIRSKSDEYKLTQ
jgi:hypothetical protein